MLLIKYGGGDLIKSSHIIDIAINNQIYHKYGTMS